MLRRSVRVVRPCTRWPAHVRPSQLLASTSSTSTSTSTSTPVSSPPVPPSAAWHRTLALPTCVVLRCFSSSSCSSSPPSAAVAVAVAAEPSRSSRRGAAAAWTRPLSAPRRTPPPRAAAALAPAWPLTSLLASHARRHLTTSSSSSSSPSPPPPSSPSSDQQQQQQQQQHHSSGFDDDRAQTMKVIIIDDHGRVKQTEMEKQAFQHRYGVHNRDLRNLDATFRNIPSILARKKVILVNLDVVKAMISARDLILFAPTSASPTTSVTRTPLHDVYDSLLPNLQSRLRAEASYPPEDRSPFEFIALESILISVCDSIERRYDHVREGVQAVLDRHNEDKDETRALMQLRPLKYGLAEFAMLVKESARAVDTLLKSDEDMVEMYLTDKALTRQPRQLKEHEEMELLLETYFRKMQEVENELTTIARNIEATENEIQILLDSSRNSIMKVELLLSIFTVGIATGGLVGGIFGMNLRSGLEQHPMAFYYTTGLLVLVAIAVIRGWIRFCARHNIAFNGSTALHHVRSPRFPRRASAVLGPYADRATKTTAAAATPGPYTQDWEAVAKPFAQSSTATTGATPTKR